MEVSKEFVPYLNVTTHLADSPDQDLLSEKGGTGFPTLFFMEPDTGAVLNDWWSPRDEKTVRAMLAKATAQAELLTRLIGAAREKPDDAGAQASARIMRAMVKLEEIPVEELEKLRATEGLDAEVRAQFDAWIAGKKVASVQESAGEKAESREEYIGLMETGFYDLLKEGVRLPSDHASAQMYYDLGLNGAVARGDAEIGKVAFEGYKATLDAIAEADDDMADRVAEAIAAAKARLDGISAQDE